VFPADFVLRDLCFIWYHRRMPEEPEEEAFTFRDRRGMNAETTPAPQPVILTEPAPIVAPVVSAPTVTEELEQAEESEQAEDPSGNPLPDVWSMLMYFMEQMQQIAWLRMGLIPEYLTEKDLNQARVAVDTVAMLAKQLEAVIAPEERLPLQAMVSDLRLKFVEQSKLP
jgi:hypothetical protein